MTPWRMIEISQTNFSADRRSSGAEISLPRVAAASAGVNRAPSCSTNVVGGAVVVVATPLFPFVRSRNRRSYSGVPSSPAGAAGPRAVVALRRSRYFAR